MDVSGALHTLRKHWILTSVLVLLTLIAAFQAWASIPGPYQSTSQVVFLASQQASKPSGAARRSTIALCRARRTG